MGQLAFALKTIKEEFDQSRLLQFAIPVILIALTFYLIDVMVEQQGLVRQELNQLLQRERKYEELQAGTDWARLGESELNRQARIEGHIWQAETIELAAADLQTSIRKLVNEKVQAVRIQVAEPNWLQEAQLWRVSAEISGRAAGDEVQSLMLAMEQQQPPFMIERFSFAPGRGGVLLMQLSIYVALKEALGNSDMREGSR